MIAIATINRFVPNLNIWIEKWTENEEKDGLEFFMKLLNQIKGENLRLNLKRFRDFTIRKITTRG